MRSPLNFTFQSTSLSVAFLLTGVATALLGATLPILLKKNHLTDTTGGLLLLLAWGGSTCGALLCRGNLRHAAASGLLITAVAMLLIAPINAKAVLPLFAIYGLGQGISMTAITLLCSQNLPETARHSTLMRLNLLWSVGACLSPTLTIHALRFTRSGGLFALMGAIFCASAITVWLSKSDANEIMATTQGTTTLRTPPPTLYVMAFLAVGTESAIGGWLTTYAGRTAHTELVTVSAITAFWGGLLLSRALHSLPDLRWLHTAPTTVSHAAIAAIATAMLLAAPHTAAFLPCALLAGFGLGPLYPRVLAMVVGTYKPRAVFILAGVGSAALPWLTGALSHAASSLGAGLLVPCIGAAILLVLALGSIHSKYSAK